MANTTNKKFGVVHGAPSQLSSATIEEGKLYFLAGEADGAIKQGIYGVDGITADASGNVTDYNLAMFGCGSVADGTGYGLSQANFTTDEKNKLAEFDAASTYLTTSDASTDYLKIKDASYFRTVKVGTTSIVADSSKDTLEFVAGSNVTITPDESNDKITISATDTVYTGTSPINVSGTSISHTNSGVTAGRYGDSSGARALEFGGKFKVVDVSVDAFGHVTKAASYELTLPAKPSTAGTADKTTGTLTFKVNGTDASTFNGSANTSLNFKNGTNISISEETDGVIKIDTSGVPTISDMSTAIDDKIAAALTSALKYKGTVDGSNYTTKLNVSNANIGDVYVANASFTTTTDYTTNAYSIEVGDYFIFNGTKFDVVGGENQVENKDATLGVGSKTNIAVIDGSTISVALPAKGDAYYTHPVAGTPTQSLGNASKNTTVAIGTETKIATVYDVSFDASGHYKGKVARDISINITSNNTDEKVKANTSTGKFYLIGQDDENSGTTETAYKNASVYVDGGYLYSGGAKVLTGYTEQYQGTVKWVYPGTGLTNGTDDSSITETGTLNLKIASSNEIGGVKPGTTSGKTYGVQVNASTGEMTVNVPWTDNNDNTWRNVYVGNAQVMSTATDSGSLKFVDGTNITAKWDSTNKTIQFDASGLATDAEVATAKSEAIEAATIYWETL